MRNILLGIVNNTKVKEDNDIVSMINYILYKGISKAVLSDWILHKNIYDTICSKHIVELDNYAIKSFNKTFGTNISKRDLYNSNYYCIDTGKVGKLKFQKSKIERINSYEYIVNDLHYVDLDCMFRDYCAIVESEFDWFNWIKRDIKTAVDIAMYSNYCLITDMILSNINLIKDNGFLYGGVIIIEREEDTRWIADPNVFYITKDNNTTKLFYSIVDIITKIINKI